MRPDGRKSDELRKIKITKDFINNAEGSVLIEMGDTKVICTASIEDKVPPFLRDQKKGWVTGEYSMLPRSTSTRMVREAARGKVYAVDIAPDFVANILRTAREQGLANVEGVVNTPKSAALPDASIDIAFVAATYHHFEYPQAMLASIRAALRPGARFFVIDFRKDPAVASPWVMGHVRTDRQAVIDEVTRAGFVFEGEPLRLWRDYMLAFRRAQD